MPGPTPRGARSPEPGRGKRDRAAPLQASQTGRDRGRTRRGARTEWNGPTSAQHRNRARCARHTNPGRGGGGGARTPRERERTHTQRTHGKTRRATGRSLQNAQTAWNGVPASEDKGHPDGTARHTQRRKRGAGRGKRGRHNTRHRPQPPRTGRERRTHTTRALHPPRQ